MTTPALTAADGPELLETAAEHSTANVQGVTWPDRRRGAGRPGGERLRQRGDGRGLPAGRLAGLVTIERLLAADPTADVADVMESTDRCPEHRSGTGSVDPRCSTVSPVLPWWGPTEGSTA